MKHKIVSLSCICLFSFLGGSVMQYIMSSTASYASTNDELSNTAFKRFYDNNGKVRLDMGVNNNNPMQDFYGEDGKLRLQFGTYVAEGEKGLPLVALSDNQGEIRLLLRLAGNNESPVLVFKDKQHRDRMVFGLGLNDASQEPFLAYFDKDGNKHMAFGEY